MLVGLVSTAGCASDNASDATAAVCGPKVKATPCAEASVGVEYPAAIVTHCGVEWVYVAGRYWVVDPAQPGRGFYQTVGHLTLIGEDELVLFRGDNGERYAFKPAPHDYSPRACY